MNTYELQIRLMGLKLRFFLKKNEIIKTLKVRPITFHGSPEGEYSSTLFFLISALDKVGD